MSLYWLEVLRSSDAHRLYGLRKCNASNGASCQVSSGRCGVAARVCGACKLLQTMKAASGYGTWWYWFGSRDL